MANSLTALNPELWSRRMQIVRIDEAVFESIANMEERSVLKKGDAVHRPYRSNLRVQTYTKGTSITPGDLTATDESLNVDQSKVVSFYFDDIDDSQNGYDTVSDYAADAGRELYDYIDSFFLGEVFNGDLSVDDSDMNGGTSGNAFDLTPANVTTVFTKALRKFKAAKADMKSLAAVISPGFYAALLERLEGKDSTLGDTISNNGSVGTYMGFKLHVSNNLPLSARWTPANNPSNNDTVTIDGVVFTFVSSIGSTEGNVLIGGSTAATLDNFVALITAPTTTTANGVGFTTESKLRKVQMMTLTDGTTYVDLKYYGGSEATVTGSDTNDVWSNVTVHQRFEEIGATDLVMQEMPTVEFRKAELKLGDYIHTWTLYGIKTFAEGTDVLMNVRVKATTL